jgi:hypothetical protein
MQEHDLLSRCLYVYWGDGDLGIGARERMQAVIFEIAGTVRSWAPPEARLRICHLAVTEIADRLLRESDHVHENDPPCTAPTATPQPAVARTKSFKPEMTPSSQRSDSANA